jgi:hypothetical protein
MDPNWRETIDRFGLDAAAQIAALEREVPPPVFERILALCSAVDDNGANRLRQLCDDERNRVLAHFGPDWARLYAIVQEHIQHDFMPNCAIPGHVGGIPTTVCTLPPVDPWVHEERLP